MDNPTEEKTKGREKDYVVIGLLVVWTILCLIFIWGWLALSRRISILESVSSAEPHSVTSPVSNTNTSTSAGGSVILGEDDARREKLKTEPELKTADLAFLLGVTNDAITKRIETAEDGTKWFPYGEEGYRVEKFQNTYKIQNPFFGNTSKRNIPE